MGTAKVSFSQESRGLVTAQEAKEEVTQDPEAGNNQGLASLVTALTASQTGTTPPSMSQPQNPQAKATGVGGQQTRPAGANTPQCPPQQ